MQEFFSAVLLTVAGLFPIINPPGAGFIALTLVPHLNAGERSEVARRVAVNSFVILVCSLSFGAYVLSFFGISIPVLRLAGGIVVAGAGWKLLQAPDEEETPAPSLAHSSIAARAFYPLTLPITVGPGTIAVAVALGSGTPHSLLSVEHVLGVVVALLILCLSIYLCLRFASNLQRLLGRIGTQITMRLFAFILFCIGIQICWLGLSDLIHSLRAT